MQQGEGGSLLLAVFCRDAEFRVVFFASCPQWRLCCVVPCRDAEFCGVFFASCPGWALPYRFSIATQSFLPFFLRRVLGDCVSVWFRAATQSFGLFFLRRVLWGLCRTVSQSRRRVSCRFPCVVSWVIAFLCGSLSRRRVSGCFLCVVSCGGSAVPFLNRDAEFLAVFPASCPSLINA